MREKLIIYGNGQMARMFLHFARTQFDVVAFTVDRAVVEEREIEGLPVIPFEEITTHLPPASHAMITAVGYLAMNALRAEKYAAALALGYRFVNYVHPSVVWHPTLVAGQNNVILDHVAMHPYTRLGNCNFICSNASIGHGCRIGDNCWINSGVSIGGETQLGDGCFLGAGCWHPEPDDLAKIRALVVEKPDHWFAARDDRRFRKDWELRGDSHGPACCQRRLGHRAHRH